MKATITNCSLVLFLHLFLFINTATAQKRSYIPDELIVDLSQTTELEALREFQEFIGAQIIKEDKLAQLELWKIPSFPIRSDEKGVAPLKNIIDILNHTYGNKPDVNEFGLNYVLDGPAPLSDILNHFELEKYTPAPYCPDFTPGLPVSSNHQPKIAIIDSGVDHYTMHELYSQFNIELSIANNFVDSIPFIPVDKHGHGTQIMGAIMGTLTAWEVPSANFVPYKVIDKNGRGTLFGLLQAIYKTANDGADVVNLSLGFYPDPLDHETVDLVNKAMLALEANDILAIIAAGNSSESLDTINFYPANVPVSKKVVVAASNCLDSLAKFSNFGPTTVHLAVPGTDILCPTLNSEWVLASGSSYSAAITTAFAAALFSMNSNSNTDVIQCSLLNGVITNDYLSNLTISGGILTAEALLSQYLSGACNPTDFPTIPSSQDLGQISPNMVYPNPTRGNTVLRMEASVQHAVQINLFDMNGRRIRSFRENLVKGINQIPIDLNGLSSGIYYLSSPGLKNFRIVKH